MNGKDNSTTTYPKTLVDAVKYFAVPSVALEFFKNLRWPGGVACPHCGSTNVLFLANQSRWKCREKHARPQFTVKIGTVMEESPMGLDKWAVAFWLEVNAKNSISSYELHRALGITQKSAWFMLHRIRLATQDGTAGKMGGGSGGIVEADETYIGGKAEFMHKAKRKRVVTGSGPCGSGKVAVMGLLERNSEKRKSRVRTAVLTNTKKPTIHEVIRTNVEPGTQLCTDALKSYNGLTPDYIHAFIDHAEKYVEGIVHTNGLENFWSLFKRCIKGTHVSVDPFHLRAYLDSECFRFNNREFKDGERFLLALRRIEGKRLTYKGLIGAMEEAPGSDQAAQNVAPVN